MEPANDPKGEARRGETPVPEYESPAEETVGRWHDVQYKARSRRRGRLQPRDRDRNKWIISQGSDARRCVRGHRLINSARRHCPQAAVATERPEAAHEIAVGARIARLNSPT